LFNPRSSLASWRGETVKRALIVLACLVVGVALTASVASARVVPVDQRLYGAPYEAWLAHWWKATAKRSMQAETALLAAQGNRCGLDTGKVWFLPASVNGLLHVHCTIPRGIICSCLSAARPTSGGIPTR
jgi:hypothetical protein